MRVFYLFMGIIFSALLAMAYSYSLDLFYFIVAAVLLWVLISMFQENEIEDDELYSQEMQLDIQEEVREMLCKSQRKHKVKYIENALAAYQELYGKDDFYQEIWREVYEEFYKEKEKEE